MRPPYDPAHVEQVVFPRSQTATILARCSCGWEGGEHNLAPGGVARRLAEEFNAHRATYVQAGAA